MVFMVMFSDLCLVVAVVVFVPVVSVFFVIGSCVCLGGLGGCVCLVGF